LTRIYAVRIVSDVTGVELKRLRTELGLTQVELAAHVGITSNSIARQERGEIGISEPVARLIRMLAEMHRQPKTSKR
jgi:transcriptional regulator with XRE-family HTH domain